MKLMNINISLLLLTIFVFLKSADAQMAIECRYEEIQVGGETIKTKVSLVKQNGLDGTSSYISDYVKIGRDTSKIIFNSYVFKNEGFASITLQTFHKRLLQSDIENFPGASYTSVTDASAKYKVLVVKYHAAHQITLSCP